MKTLLLLLTMSFIMSITISAIAVPQHEDKSVSPTELPNDRSVSPSELPNNRSVSSSEPPTCVFESADVGKMKFRGTSREEAFERTARACLQARVQGYIKIRGDVPSSERKILFAEDCVNKTYCKH